MPFVLPDLPYAYDALEPYIDAETMHLHHDKHHEAYRKKLVEAVEKHPDLGDKPAEELLRDLNSVPEDIRTAIRNHGGGYVSHCLFWESMKPSGGGEPSGELGEAIEKTFGNFAELKTKFNEAGTKHFGSGWVWLVVKDGDLSIITTANQDSPLSQGIVPLMGNDLWEHAYYLKYQNRRPEYLEAWWNVLNWDAIEERFNRA
ncbi:superoxide dismutase [Patescibacteria group bacterium]|nr:superoxide dismutase [Patescibacteria group bacterium]